MLNKITKPKQDKEGGPEDAKENKKKDLTFNFDEWKQKFIYPYLKGVNESIKCEDENGKMKEYCGVNISTTEDLINSELLRFPLDAVSTQKDYLIELQKPIVITIEDLQKDLYKFQKDFPKESLPKIDLFTDDNELENANRINSQK